MEKHNKNSNKTSLSDSKSQEVQYDIAYKKVKKIKGFYVHLLVYILVNIFVLFKKYYSKEATIFLGLADIQHHIILGNWSSISCCICFWMWDSF